MKVKLAAITYDSIVDGPGIRTVIWFQGCHHKCPGCHNPQTHDFNGGYEEDVDNIIEICNTQLLQDGVTISGGDPFYQPEALEYLISNINTNIWVYTGFNYEYLLNKYKNILQYIDVLVDGPYIESLRDLTLLFRGSSNQRLIDIKKSINNNIVLYSEKKA